MDFVKPKVKIWQQEIPPQVSIKEVFCHLYLEAMYQHIEKCGRVCYKSEDKLGNKDPKIFIDRLISTEHFSVLEHGTVYMKTNDVDVWQQYVENPYSKVNRMDEKKDGKYVFAITTNYRVIVENGWYEDLKYLCVPTQYHAKRTTVCFSTDIGVSREANRHRKNSISEESTRYCNYSKDKFGSNVSYIIPAEISEADLGPRVLRYIPLIEEDHIREIPTTHWDAIDWFIWSLRCSEIAYMKLTQCFDWSAQLARRVLPLDTKTTLIHTAFNDDWEHFLDLRSRGTTGAPHPDMKKVADMLLEKMKKEKEKEE